MGRSGPAPKLDRPLPTPCAPPPKWREWRDPDATVPGSPKHAMAKGFGVVGLVATLSVIGEGRNDDGDDREDGGRILAP